MPNLRDALAYQYAVRGQDYVPPQDIQDLLGTGGIYRTDIAATQATGGETPVAAQPAQYLYQANPSLLPTTQYGDISNVRAFDVPSGQAAGGFKLRNPNLKYEDQNYGWITPSANTIDPSSQRNWLDMIGPIYMSLVLAGAGMAAGGANAAAAAEAGAGAGAGSGGAGAAGLGYNTSIPWYAKLGMSAVRAAGASTSKPSVPTPVMATPSTSAAAPEPPPPLVTGGFDPTLYGSMGDVAAPSDGSQYVATASAPDAYNNSYNQVIG